MWGFGVVLWLLKCWFRRLKNNVASLIEGEFFWIADYTDYADFFYEPWFIGFKDLLDKEKSLFVGAELDSALYKQHLRVKSSHEDKFRGASTLLPTFFGKFKIDFDFIIGIMVLRGEKLKGSENFFWPPPTPPKEGCFVSNYY